MTDGEPFLAPGLRTWMVRMIEDDNQQFLGGDVVVIALREPRHVRCRQSLASGRGCVKQRPNQPNSAAQTAVLSHMV
jgi:hypothetical protein